MIKNRVQTKLKKKLFIWKMILVNKMRIVSKYEFKNAVIFNAANLNNFKCLDASRYLITDKLKFSDGVGQKLNMQ